MILNRAVLPRQSVLSVQESITYIKKAHDRNLDKKLTLSNIRFSTPDIAQVGDAGIFRLTDNAKSQLGSTFGIRWDKWFGYKDVSADVINGELKKRYEKMSDSEKHKMLRLRVFEKKEATGVLGAVRAVVGESYTPIDDYPVMNMVNDSIGNEVLSTDVRVMSAPWNDKECDIDTNITLLLKNEIVIKDNGKEDIFYPALHISNSEVGRGALAIEDAIMRVVCINGMIRMIYSHGLARQIHKVADFDDFRQDLMESLSNFKLAVPTMVTRLTDAHKRKLTLDEFNKLLEGFISKNSLPKSFIESVTEAHKVEFEMTRFGLVQAITRAAHELPAHQAYAAEAHASSLL